MMDHNGAKLAHILAHVRAGATDRAWRLFLDGGMDARRDDPAALTLHGRLLKDRARAAAGEQRRLGFAAAANSYAAAAALAPATYPLINAATLELLAGHRERSRTLAAETIMLLDRTDLAELETAYFKAATRAEALLLLEDAAAARHWLEVAYAAAPQAWEDHATTLRQFAEISAALGTSDDWLAHFRPPRSAHFSGTLSVGDAEAALAAAAGDWFAVEHVGFAYGALAAGTDIIVAEAAVRAGLALHVVLPGSVAAFRRACVEPNGTAWGARFDALIAAAESVRAIDESVPSTTPALIALADDLAMGLAIANARRLESEALQFVADTGTRATNSDRVWRRWRVTGRRQHRLPLVPDAGSSVAIPGDSGGPATGQTIVLAIDFVAPPETAGARVADALAAWPPAVRAAWMGSTLVVAYDAASDAVGAATAIADVLPHPAQWRMGIHAGVDYRMDDPITGGESRFGTVAPIALRIAAAAPAGTIIASDVMAAAAAVLAIHSEPIGELLGEPPIALFSLRR